MSGDETTGAGVPGLRPGEMQQLCDSLKPGEVVAYRERMTEEWDHTQHNDGPLVASQEIMDRYRHLLEPRS